MALSTTQRKHLAAIRRLLKSSTWSDVKQGLALLDASDDAEIWEVMSEGISISEDGSLSLAAGEVKARVKVASRENVALHVARHMGLLSKLTTLNLRGSRTLSDLSPLRGLHNLVEIDLRFCGCCGFGAKRALFVFVKEDMIVLLNLLLL